MKMLGCDHNVQHKMPQGTHESKGCLYPLRYVVLTYNENRETNEFT